MSQPHGSLDDRPIDQSPASYLATLLNQLHRLQAAESMEEMRCTVADLQKKVLELDSGFPGGAENDAAVIDPVYLGRELEQIAAAHTLERAQYYVERLIRSFTEIRTGPVNDINLNRWKAYDHIITDSLWVIDRRDSSGVHAAGYWGNFVPQIPHQLMLRYTKAGEWVLDPFAGAGTTLIEAQRLGRHTIGIELQSAVADRARQDIRAEPNQYSVVSEIVTGDSLKLDYGAILAHHNQRSVQLVIMHPPYFDIIKFSDDPRDLCNAATVPGFMTKVCIVVDKARSVLDKGRYLALVIGDKYSKGEWIPLGFLAMDHISQRGFRLKSIVVKNFEETAGKRNQKELWRYRALAGGFYIFRHEYIFVFQKR